MQLQNTQAWHLLRGWPLRTLSVEDKIIATSSVKRRLLWCSIILTIYFILDRKFSWHEGLIYGDFGNNQDWNRCNCGFNFMQSIDRENIFSLLKILELWVMQNFQTFISNGVAKMKKSIFVITIFSFPATGVKSLKQIRSQIGHLLC